MDLLLDRVKVGERSTQPALRHKIRTTPVGFGFDDRAQLSLGANEQNVVTLQDDFPHQLLSRMNLAKCLLKID
jgi:hypothetical protein